MIYIILYFLLNILLIHADRNFLNKYPDSVRIPIIVCVLLFGIPIALFEVVCLIVGNY